MNRYDDDEDDEDDFDIDRRRSSRRRRDRDDFYGDEIDVGESKRLAAGLCAIMLGTFGIHKFILGYGMEGSILLSMTLIGIVLGLVGVFAGAFCCFPIVLMVFFVLPMVTGTIALIEGIIYLTKSDEEFIELYQIGQRTWF